MQKAVVKCILKALISDFLITPTLAGSWTWSGRPSIPELHVRVRAPRRRARYTWWQASRRGRAASRNLVMSMVQLKHSEKRILEDALDMGSGYVLNFSDRTFAEFFEDQGITIYQDKYAVNGASKAKYMRAFIQAETAFTVCRVLRQLWDYRESIPQYQQSDTTGQLKTRFFALLDKLESGDEIPRTDAVDRFASDQTLDELVASIERDIGVNRPAAALDRLHTYCMRKFGHLLDVRGVAWERAEPLHSRVGKYVKALGQERELRDVTAQIIKNAIGVFDKFNHVRNNQSLAHDNDLLDQAEARFIYDSVTAILRFVKSIETNQFAVAPAPVFKDDEIPF